MIVNNVNGPVTDVPLRTGPPTKEELLFHYPAKFTWNELKTFINSGDLGLLKRDKALQARYNVWIKTIKVQYGTVANYLVNYRLQWGKPDTLSLLQSSLNQPVVNGQDSRKEALSNGDIPIPPLDATIEAATKLPAVTTDYPTYFTVNTPPELISIIQNDWPYSVPPDIEHTLVWTRLPIIDFSRAPSQITARLIQDGIWGFTGCSSSPPSPSTLPSCLPSLADWGVTMDKLIRSPKVTPEEDRMIKEAGREVDQFVKNRWLEKEWETAYFINPPRLQSIPDVSHIHVFARRKSAEEMARGEF